MSVKSEIESSAHARSPNAFFIALLYAGSGAATMAHEVLWTRMARSLLGGDARALAVALVATLVGLGAGALAAPRLLRRWNPVGSFVRVEAVAAIFAALLPWLVQGVHPLIGVLYRALGDGAGFSIASFVVAVVILLPATFALGAGLPLLAAAFPKSERMSGVLYGVHAGGSAIGASFVGFALLPAWGAPLCALCASGLQALVCVLASRIRAPSRIAETNAVERWSAPSRQTVLILLPLMLAGLSSFALQSLWTRVAAMAMGPTVQSFALVATLYVVALFIGALAAAILLRFIKQAWVACAAAVLAAGIFALFRVANVGAWPIDATPVFASIRDGRVSYDALMELFFPTVVPTVAFFGAAFAFAAAGLKSDLPQTANRALGYLLAFSAAGNALGSILAPFVFVPYWGLALAIKIAALGAGVAGLLLLALRLRAEWKASLIVAVPGIVLLVWMSARAPNHFNADSLTSGPFLYAGPAHPDLGDVIFAHDGVDATVTVRRSGAERLLQIDGKVDGSTLGDAPTQTLVGLLPTLFAANPSRALVIGLGTGMTVDAVRSVPGVSRVDVAELVAGVHYAAPAFANATHHVLRDPRVHVIATDGSLLLRHSDQRWDVIVNEPSNPWVAGMGDLFSEETFRAARDHLRDGGVMATWFHVYATDLTIVREIMATFAAVFPNASLWELTRGEDYMLLGTKEPQGIDADRLVARAGAANVVRALTAAGVPDLPSLLGRLVASSDGVARGVREINTLSSRDGSLEARAARSLYQDASKDALAFFDEISVREQDLRVRASSAAAQGLALAWPGAIEARALARRVVLRALDGDEDGAIFLGERAMGLAPHDTSIQSLVATLYLSRGKTHALAQEFVPARDALLTVLEIDPPELETRVDALVTLGDLDVATGHARQGLDRYQRARRMRPESADIADRIAVALSRLGATDDAAREHALAQTLRSRQTQ
ncbi:MAG: hypothetical protein IPK60_14540 [Sandaracinaceae bacterium]|nr:hypothetical protein [Sandaracinaceae bacterium]